MLLFWFPMEIIDINFRDILFDEKKIPKYFNLWNFIQNYFYGFSNIAYYRFNKIDGCIKIYDGIRYLVLFSYLYDEICNRINYLISKESVITDSFDHNFARIRIDSYNSLLIEKMLTFHNFIILIKSVFNENKDEDKSDTQYF